MTSLYGPGTVVTVRQPAGPGPLRALERGDRDRDMRSRRERREKQKEEKKAKAVFDTPHDITSQSISSRTFKVRISQLISVLLIYYLGLLLQKM